MSASRLPALLGHSKYSTANDQLQLSIDAINGKARDDQTNESMEWGNRLEAVILREAACRLQLDDIHTHHPSAYLHAKLALACSLDGEGVGDGSVITSDLERGIYVVGQDSIKLDGLGVLEAKLTKTPPEDVPALWRGPIQLQAQMMITGHRWGAVCVLYQGTELRIFLFDRHEATEQAIAHAVEDFQRRLNKYQATGEIEWYPPTKSAELDRMYAHVEYRVVELGEDAGALAMKILAAKADKAKLDEMINTSEMQLKSLMQDAEKARAGRYAISWPMRNYRAQPEKITPAKAAFSVRQSTLAIKEVA
jgi:hypothetical protein